MRGGADLYVIQSAVTGAFKVGRSSNVEQRLRQLQTGSPFQLRIVLVWRGKGHLEHEVHERLHAFRSRDADGEWFIEPGLAELDDRMYERLDPCVLENWWMTERGPVHIPGPWCSQR